MSIAEKHTILNTEKIPQVYEAKQKAFWKSFATSLINIKGEVYCRYSFAGFGWNKDTFNPSVTISPNDARYMFNISNVTSVNGSQVDFTQSGEMRDVFYSCTLLETLEFKLGTSGEGRVKKTFNDNSFALCAKLTNLSIIGTIEESGINLKDCTSLSKQSIINVVTALSESTSGLSITLPESVVNSALTTEEWGELEGSRTNWLISLK